MSPRAKTFIIAMGLSAIVALIAMHYGQIAGFAAGAATAVLALGSLRMANE